MRRQQMVAARSHGTRNFILFLIVVGLAVFAVKDPTGAAAFVRDLGAMFGAAVDGIVTFVQAVS